MAAVQTTGVPAPEAGVLIALVASALFVAGCSVLCSAMIGGLTGLLVAIAIAAMPAIVLASGMCWSDGPYLLLSLASLGALMLARRGDRGWAWTAAAGALAGIAWGTRYVGVALVLAEALFLIAAAVFRQRHAVLVWLLACGAGAAPFAARSLRLFGRLVPYEMERSTSGAGEVLNQAVRASAAAIGGGSPYMGAAHLIPGVALAAIVAILLVAFAAVALRRALTRRDSPGSRFAVHADAALLVSYAVLHAVVVVSARMRWQWGETIGTRHLLPVFWTIWILIGYAALHLGPTADRARRAGLHAVLLAAIVLYLSADRWWALHTTRSAPPVLTSGLADRLLADVGPRRFVLSTEATVLRIHGVNARQIQPGGAPLESCLESGRSEGALWGVVVEDLPSARDGYYGPTLQALAASSAAPGFRRWSGDSAAVAFEYVGAR